MARLGVAGPSQGHKSPLLKTGRHLELGPTGTLCIRQDVDVKDHPVVMTSKLTPMDIC